MKGVGEDQGLEGFKDQGFSNFGTQNLDLWVQWFVILFIAIFSYCELLAIVSLSHIFVFSNFQTTPFNSFTHMGNLQRLKTTKMGGTKNKDNIIMGIIKIDQIIVRN